ncbi:channel protein, MIP family [Dictyocaulus viviparus]|uniref:Channel protein, MIP family n=1 Tax=Dictyocaulus viviparus TaxID=29172 RepID=A0A0D8Y3Q1_DICVI|nr:channel protein, MIP family [Dictyocaulus viviparus]
MRITMLIIYLSTLMSGMCLIKRVIKAALRLPLQLEIWHSFNELCTTTYIASELTMSDQHSSAEAHEAVYTPDILRKAIQIKSPLARNILSEFCGTALLLFLGDSIVMQFILSGEKLSTYTQINLGWCFTITFVVYCCSKLSGGQLNPAISLMLVTLGKLSVPHFFIYWIVQTLGAFVGAGAAYAVYYDQFRNFTGGIMTIDGHRGTARCFCSFPRAHVSNATCFLDQVVGTGILSFFVNVVVDKRNNIPDFLHPLLFGFVLILIGTCFGLNLGYPINPARDLGPRVLASFIYGGKVFTYHNYYFWIPVIAPMVGAVLFAWMYHACFGSHIPDVEEHAPHAHKGELILESTQHGGSEGSSKHRKNN